MKGGMESRCWVPESRVRMAGEGREGGGELHRVEERVRCLLLVWHGGCAAIQGLPTSQLLLWLRLQSSESAGWGAGPPVYLGTWPPPNTGPLLPTGFPLLHHPLAAWAAPHRPLLPPSPPLRSLSAAHSLSSELSFALELSRGALASQSHIPLSSWGRTHRCAADRSENRRSRRRTTNHQTQLRNHSQENIITLCKPWPCKVRDRGISADYSW